MTIPTQDLDANNKRMNIPWYLPKPTEIWFNHLVDGKRFAKKADDTIEDSVLTKIGYNIIFNNGIFNQVCYEWCKLTRNCQSWIPFKIQLTATDKDPVNHRTLEDTSYHNANNATTDTDITNISTLTEANSLQTNTKQANFTKMFEILEKHGKKF